MLVPLVKTNATLFDDGREQIMFVSRKEVFQPHLPVRLPCLPDSHGLTGGVYKSLNVSVKQRVLIVYSMDYQGI
uniref:CPSF_A domain-containing protein n=1 Tax=Globodera pallida TaxID=36090 RepID=A0A183BQU4_GLOPA